MNIPKIGQKLKYIYKKAGWCLDRGVVSFGDVVDVVDVSSHFIYIQTGKSKGCIRISIYKTGKYFIGSNTIFPNGHPNTNILKTITS